jgi:hypothetical protein
VVEARAGSGARWGRLPLRTGLRRARRHRRRPGGGDPRRRGARTRPRRGARACPAASARDDGRGVPRALHAEDGEAACLLGSGRPELGAFGLSLGIAFQIVDDCLDCSGQTVETGKIAGTDLREGIPTLPLLLAAREDEVVRRALAGGSLDGAMLRVAASGAIEEAHEVAREYAEQARACLDGVPAREELDAITDAVVERTA